MRVLFAGADNSIHPLKKTITQKNVNKVKGMNALRTQYVSLHKDTTLLKAKYSGADEETLL